MNHEHYSNLANALKDNNKVLEAIDYYESAIKLNPMNSDAYSNWLHSKIFVCNWTNYYERFEKLKYHIVSQIKKG